MPVHDWQKVEAGIFHHFHQRWSAELCDRFNTGGLPAGYYALIEQWADFAVPDVLTFERLPAAASEGSGGLALATTPPQARFVMSANKESFVAKANVVVIRHPLGDVVAVLEIVSPGNEDSRSALRSFVEKSLALLNRGVNLLIIDLMPPSKRDPEEVHGVIWEELDEQGFVLPADKRLTLASYAAGPPKTAYVEPVAVGDRLPPMPLFLGAGAHVLVPLEQSYARTWSLCPLPMREHVERAD